MTNKTDIAVINTKLDDIKEDMTDIKKSLERNYATKAELTAVDERYRQTK